MQTPNKEASELLYRAEALRKTALEMRMSDPVVSARLLEMAFDLVKKADQLQANTEASD